ncbi:putative reverse transcriptase domain-containing protein [Tanacetum coccineum]
MSDSEHSTVTYTSISSDYEEPSDVGSPGVVVYGYGVLLMHPLSPDYVPGPEHPPSPVYVPYVSEPAYPEFMPPEDDVFPAKEQPLPATVLPTADSPGYITESDPEEDPKEEDEDPKEDPTNYPSDRDDEEEEESSRDDDNDEEEEEEGEHLASADFVLPPAYRTTARMSIRAQTPISFPSKAEIPSPPLPISPTHPLGYKAAMIRLRAESPFTSHPLPLPPPIVLPWTPPLLPIPLPTSSPPLLLPFINYKADVLEVTLPPRKRFCIAPGLRYEIVESSSAPTTRPTRALEQIMGLLALWISRLEETWIGRQDIDEVYGRLDDAHDDRSLMSGQLNLLHRDRRSHARTARLMKSEAISSRSRPQTTDTARKGTDSDEDITNSDGSTIDLLSITGVADVLAERDATRSRNGEDSHDSRTGGTEGVVELTQWFEIMETVFRISNCIVENQIKFATCTLLRSALTWWNSHVRTVGHNVTLKIRIKSRADGKKIHTFVERQSENKRKQDDNQQQQNKRQNTGRAYAVGSGEKKPYGGSKPLCFKCNYHHDGQCDLKCHKCNRVGHLAPDCRSTANANTANNQRGIRASNPVGNGNSPAKVYAVGRDRLGIQHRYGLNAVELGSFDVIICMDWLTKYQAVIVCAVEIVRIPWGNETLIICGNGSNLGNETRLNIISCTKTQKYMLKGCHVFLAHVTTKETEDKSKEKRLEDMPIVRDFPKVFPEDLPDLPPT